jgi:GAF domain-containing protein
MMRQCNSLPLHSAFEPVLVEMFEAERAVVWENRGGCFYSASLNCTVPATNSVIDSLVCTQRSVVVGPGKEFDRDAFKTSSANSNEFFFPLVLNNGMLIAIAEISRGAKFVESDESSGNFLSRKFAIYGAAAFSQPQMITTAGKLSTFGTLRKSADHLVATLRDCFCCDQVDFWFMEVKTTLFLRYDRTAAQFLNVYRCAAGLMSPVLRLQKNTNCAFCRGHPNYLATIDGDGEHPVLACCCEFDGRVWAIALRGPRTGHRAVYSTEDEHYLSTLLPFAARSLAFSADLSPKPPSPSADTERSLLAVIGAGSAFFKARDLRGLREDVEKHIIQEIKCERVRLVYQKTRLKAGLVGSCAQNNETVNIANAEADKRFNPEVDVGPGKEITARSFLAFPIAPEEDGFVLAVLVLINRQGGGVYSIDEIAKLNALAPFIGHAIRNTTLFTDTMFISNTLKGLIKPIETVVHASTARSMLEEALKGAKSLISAKRATLYILDEDKLFVFLTVGEPARPGTEALAREAIRDQKTVTKQDHGVVQCCVPLEGSGERIIGVVEFFCRSAQKSNEYLDLVSSYAAITTVAFARLNLDQLVDRATSQAGLEQAVSTPDERTSFETPPSLGLSKCDGSDLDSIRFVFSIFDKYELKTTFRITNETLFLFLMDLSKSYVPNAPQNWKHAVDTLRFLVTCIQTARVDRQISKIQLIALVVAALAHDAGHTGFRELEQAPIPYTVLYRNHACLEIRHCKVLMQILAREECNILRGLDPADYREAWKWIIDLIYATNFGQHFSLIKQYDNVTRDTPLDLGKPRHCLVALQLLLKMADLSDLAKTDLQLGEGFFDEIFAEGELSPVLGFVFQHAEEEDRNDQILVNRERSKLPALSTICFPLFEIVCMAFPELGGVLETVQKNVELFEEAIIAARMADQTEEEEREPTEIMPTVEVTPVMGTSTEPPPESSVGQAAEEKAEESVQVSESKVRPESEVVEEPFSELIEIEKGTFGKAHSEDSESSVSRIDSTDSFSVGAPFTQEDEFADDEHSGSDGG